MRKGDDVLRALWEVIDHVAALEAELRVTGEQLAAWRGIAEAAMQALDREIAAAKDGCRVAADTEDQC